MLEWSAIEARYPVEAPAPVVAAPPPPPPAPAPEPAPAPAPAHDPRAAALADGWVQHPDSAAHGYKGTEVLAWEAIEERYPAPGNATPTPAASAPAAPATETPAAATTAGAPAAEAPAGDALSPDVQALLGKWS